MINNLLSNAKWYPFLFDTSNKTDFLRTIFFWITIVLAISFIILLLSFKDDKRKLIIKIELIASIIYSFTVAITFLTLGFIEDSIKPILFIPLAVLLFVVALSVITLCLKRTKPFVIATLALTSLAFLAVLICMGVYFSSGQAEDINGISINLSENVMLYLSTIGLLGILIAIAIIFGRNTSKGFSSKSISYAAICIAMSFALSYIRIVKLPQGGSITVASLLPLMLYSYMFGIKKGFFAGFIYGLLQAIQDPWIVHPMQFLLDYPIAFTAIGVAGCFAKTNLFKNSIRLKFSFGAIIAGLLRFASHLFSGVFAFSEYAYSASGSPMNAWLYSISYNSFVFIDIAISILVGILIFSSANFVKLITKTDSQDQN